MQTKLIFVYNADSGLFNTVTDIAHKILSPKTYSCQLCSLTHGFFSIREQWVDFLEGTNADCEFLHRDEFEKQYGVCDAELPAIFLHKDNDLSVFMSQAEINACDELPTLKQALQDKLSVTS